MLKNPPSNAGDVGLIPGRGTKIPHAAGQLSLHAASTEPALGLHCCTGFSPVAAGGGHPSVACRLLIAVIFLHQGSNPCPLHWQADSQPLCHQGSPQLVLKKTFIYLFGCVGS